MKKIDVKSLQDNVFSLIGDRWMLSTAGTAERCNTMTASWGGLGVLWGAPAATIYLRPQRYTKEFVDREEYFTLAFFGEEQRKCGAPYFEEAELVLVCRKRYAQEMDPQAIPQDAKDRFYPEKDYHTMYIGEVVEALRK